MTLGNFVRRSRPQWQRLETMLGKVERINLRHVGQPFLQELTSLYRATTGDLAYAQTHFRGTTLLLFLSQLIGRAHNQIYRPHRLTAREAERFVRREIPRAVRIHLQAVIWSAIVFLMGTVLGLSAVQFDERTASLILPSRVLDAIYSGHMWTGGIFSIVPAPVASTVIFTSNASVALLAFAGGLSAGLVTFWILFLNGFMLGVVCKLCADYGLGDGLFAFVAGHGLLEISSIIVAGGAGFVLANALLHPGTLPRREALSRQGRFAVRMVVACLPALLVAGCIEAFISPSQIPAGAKAALGLTLGILFWLYLLFTGRDSHGAGADPGRET